MKLLRDRSIAAPLGLFLLQFGRPLLNYFPLYLHSVGRNPLLNLIIITDQEVPLAQLPPNVILHHMAEEELRARLRAFLGDAFAMTADPLPGSMYKLCDYRPFFSALFADALAGRGFTHVGWCDSDVILGDLSSFLPDPSAYDLIGRLGHFTAFRRTAFFEQVPLRVSAIRRHIADTTRHWQFDEVAFSEHLLRYYVRGGKIKYFSFYDERFADVLPDPSDRFLLWTDAALPDQHLRYEDGTLVRAGGDRRIATIYAHFQKRPMEIRMRLDFRPADPLHFVIRPNYFATPASDR